MNLHDRFGVEATPLDWHGLLARLDAAHRLHMLPLADRDGTCRGASGSFYPGAARLLAGYRERLVAVNPNLSDDGKRDGGKHIAVAGTQMADGRG